MADEYKLRQDADKGQRAQIALEDPILDEAFNKLEKRFLDNWRNSNPENGRFREECYYALAALDVVKVELKTMVDNGKFARQRLSSDNQE